MMVEGFTHTWTNGTNAERFDLIQTLFEEIVVNVDTRRITSFKLQSWAEQFLILRASLYEAEKEKSQSENGSGSTFQGSNTPVPPRGFEPLFWP